MRVAGSHFEFSGKQVRSVDKQVLPVRTRRDLSEEGVGTELRVFCPFRDQSVPLDDCVECHHCDEILVGPDGLPAGVSCQRQDASGSAASAALAWDPAGAARRSLLASVGRAMQPEFVTVQPETPVEQLAKLLLDRNLDAAVVIDSAARIVGIVSKTDVFREWDRRVREPRPAEEDSPWPAADALVQDTVAEIMMPLAFTVRETDPLTQVAALLAYEGVHQLPVVSKDNRLVGMIGALDVLRWLARAEGYFVK
jgi:CBS domain-containing protein